MKRGTATTAVLVLALLAQAAVAVGRAPCTMTSADPASLSVPQHHDHAGAHADHRPMASHGQHAAHQQMMSESTSDQTAPGPAEDCCHGLKSMDCATGGCAAGAGTMLLLSTPAVASATMTRHVPPELGWLPPYLAPTTTIYRPPIA